jgi:hypothetical protein
VEDLGYTKEMCRYASRNSIRNGHTISVYAFPGCSRSHNNREISQPIYFASLDVGFILIIRHGI